MMNGLIDRYDNPVLRSLVQLVPLGVGSAADIALMDQIIKFRKRRMRAFFDELAAGNAFVDEKIIESDDFLHCFFATTNYVIQTRRTEKIQMFARLLLNSSKEDGEVDFDLFEEYASILNELGYREWRALVILEECSQHPRKKGQNDLQWIGPEWDNFCKKLESELKVPKTEASSFMGRIARTGCYKEFTGTAIGYSGGQGMLTPLFGRLKSWVSKSVEVA